MVVSKMVFKNHLLKYDCLKYDDSFFRTVLEGVSKLKCTCKPLENLQEKLLFIMQT